MKSVCDTCFWSGMTPWVTLGMQSGVLVGAAPYALPRKFRLLPEFLNGLNYSSHMVGKWHLGSHRHSLSMSHELCTSQSRNLLSQLMAHSAPKSKGMCSHLQREDSRPTWATGQATRTTMTRLLRSSTDPWYIQMHLHA